MTSPLSDYFRHYKGNMYQMIDIAIHSETQEELVIYRALYFGKDGKYGTVFARPKDMFFSKVMVGGKELPRFARITDEEYSMSTDVYK
jgi:hypothetical protein